MTPLGRPLRVVVLDHTAQLGGAELSLLRILDALPSDEVEVRVILFAEGPFADRLRTAGHRVELVALDDDIVGASRASGIGRALSGATRAVPFVARLARRLRELQPDVVHTTSLKSNLMGLGAARLARIPLVWHVHDRIADDYLPGYVVRAVRIAARIGPTAVVANSEATARTLPGARRLTVAPPGLSSDQVIADPADRRAASPPVVGMVGRISETKGQLEFVQAAEIVARSHPDITFRIVGSAMFGQESYERAVRRDIAQRGLGRRVEMVGFTDDPIAAVDALTVCVHASPVPEPFGQVVAEAMARGVSVVATRAGGVVEIVEPPGVAPGDLGRLVRPGDVRDLAEAIAATLDDPERSSRERAAWQSVRLRYQARDTADRVLQVWAGAARRKAEQAR